MVINFTLRPVVLTMVNRAGGLWEPVPPEWMEPARLGRFRVPWVAPFAVAWPSAIHNLPASPCNRSDGHSRPQANSPACSARSGARARASARRQLLLPSLPPCRPAAIRILRPVGGHGRHVQRQHAAIGQAAKSILAGSPLLGPKRSSVPRDASPDLVKAMRSPWMRRASWRTGVRRWRT
jgi:hypothetical protein